MKISVIISTYNSPVWLEKVFWGYEFQHESDFELVIADDGSGEETTDLINYYKEKSSLKITHVWHEDTGFQKSKILNQAIKAAEGDYLIFSDGDCIPRKDFVEVHQKNAAAGYFLSGGYFMLPISTSKQITKDDIENENAFDVTWLQNHGLVRTFKSLKLTAKGFQAKLLNLITPTKASWNGHNSSGWKLDLVAANGFNEDMQYGGQDRELGERLINAGIKSKQIRYSAVCIHLDHERGYKTPESIQKNLKIREETRRHCKTRTLNGITKESADN